jgi:uncharacterized protein (TIGR01370 family)
MEGHDMPVWPNSPLAARWQPLRRNVLQAIAGLLGVAAADDPGAWLRAGAAAAPAFRWIAFYGETADEQVLAGYDMVVLDRMFRGAKAAIAERGARLFGYLSLGEINTADSFFPRLDPQAVLEANPTWPATRRIDIRHPAWRALVLGSIIPAIVAEGFSGLLLDTLDTPAHLERQDPVGKRGMRQAAVELVRAIRHGYPSLALVMNRGYDLLPTLAPSLDALLAESLVTTGDAEGYRWNSDAEIAQHMALIARAAHRRPPLPVLSLDYWKPEDPAGIRNIYRRERELGHLPYVATRMLEAIVTEPAVP